MLIEAYELGRTFHSGDSCLVALAGIHLGVRPGELVAVCGPAGSGKSTLLQILGLADPDYQGRLFFAGREVRSLDPDERTRLRRLRIGLLPADCSSLLPDLSIEDNVALPHLRLWGNVQRARQRAGSLLAELGLGARLAERPAALATGERQRAALARALVNDPWLLLVDEPLACLEPAEAHELLERLARLRERGRGVVVAGRDPSLGRFADRSLELTGGRLGPAAAACRAG